MNKLVVPLMFALAMTAAPVTFAQDEDESDEEYAE